MPPVARGDLLELEIVDLATGGRGLARLDGYVVFVENALPGDRVWARITRPKGRYAEAHCEERLSDGPARVPVRCAHVGVCGGCRFQDLAYDFQLRHKEQVVRDSLKHIAGIEGVEVLPILAAPDPFHYRNKMEFSFGRDASGALALGLHHRGFFDRTFDLQRCHIADDVMNRAVNVLRELAGKSALAPYHPREHTGELRLVAMRASRATGKLLVNLVSTVADLDLFSEWARELSRRVPELQGFVFSLHRDLAQAVRAESWQVLWGEERIVERLNGLEFEISPWSFFQTNSAQAERLYREALGAAELRPDDRVLDLYCGTGTLTLTFARECAAAWGVENVEEAVADAGRNASRNGLSDRVRFFGEDARKWLRLGGASEFRPTVVVVDPPRAGLHPRVIDRTCELRPRRVVYVSCNPTTFARDLEHFSRLGYRPSRVQPVDMFPHTDHVECVAALDAAEIRSGS